MESQISERGTVEWEVAAIKNPEWKTEARRYAAVFGVALSDALFDKQKGYALKNNWRIRIPILKHPRCTMYFYSGSKYFAELTITGDNGSAFSFSTPYGEQDWHVAREFDHITRQHLPVPEDVARLAVRFVMCAGVDWKAVALGLDYFPTNHEQLEWRLSMPREFWPQKWLDEASQ